MIATKQVQAQTKLSICHDWSKLHPLLRDSVQEILAQCKDADMPFQLFEGYRTPERQQYLYAQGRTRRGQIVTKSKPWQSYHQYGLAVDIVLKIDNDWCWSAKGELRDYWNSLALIAEKYGLEGLSYELPHFQLAGFDLYSLQSGSLPGGGDNSWWSNLVESTQGWSDKPGTPRIGTGA